VFSFGRGIFACLLSIGSMILRLRKYPHKTLGKLKSKAKEAILGLKSVATLYPGQQVNYMVKRNCQPSY